MITVQPLNVISLDHLAYEVTVAMRSGDIVAIGMDGAGTFIEAENLRMTSISLPEPRTIAMHPDGKFVAASTNRGLLLLNTRSGVIRTSGTGTYEGCQFSPSGEYLWACRRPSKTEATLELRTTSTLEVIACHTFPDPTGDSLLTLWPHPYEFTISMWAAAGPAGQFIYWAGRVGGSISVDQFAGPLTIKPPVFSPKGNSFLAVTDFATLHHFDDPDGQHRVVGTWSLDGGSGNMSDAMFAGPDHALFQSSWGRIGLVDLHRNSLVDELVVAGHELRPRSELHPDGPVSPGLGTDLSTVLPVHGDTFLSVHHRVPIDVLEGKDDILTWKFAPGAQ